MIKGFLRLSLASEPEDESFFESLIVNWIRTFVFDTPPTEQLDCVLYEDSEVESLDSLDTIYNITRSEIVNKEFCSLFYDGR